MQPPPINPYNHPPINSAMYQSIPPPPPQQQQQPISQISNNMPHPMSIDPTAAPPSTQSNTVFVGNLPYDTSEQQLIELFSSVGPVNKLRMMTDKETGKPKGYGFIEYHDHLTAMSAIRNLNGTEYRGRAIKVDYSDSDTTGV